MSSSQDNDQAASGSASGSRNTTPAARFSNLEAAHRTITGAARTDAQPHENLPGPSVHGNDDGQEEADTSAAEREEQQRQEQAWFDEVFPGSSSSEDPPSGEDIPVSAGETDNERATTEHIEYAGVTTEHIEYAGHDTGAQSSTPYAPSDSQATTAASSGFNPALAAVNLSSSNHSASIYRAAPDQMRREGATGRIGFHNAQHFSDEDSQRTLTYDQPGSLAQTRSESVPSLPLPMDPPEHPMQADHPIMPDPSVSSVTNSQALLHGALSSPPIRTYQAGHRQNRQNLPPSVPPPVLPRQRSRGDRSRDPQGGDTRFASLFGTERQASRVYNIDEEDEWSGPGPAIVRSVMEPRPLARLQPAPTPSQSHLGVPEATSAGTSRHTSGTAPESATSSSRDPFYYDNILLPAAQERNVTSRLRTMTGSATVFSQSPLNTPEHGNNVQDAPVNDTQRTPSRAPANRRRPEGFRLDTGDRDAVIRRIEAEAASVDATMRQQLRRRETEEHLRRHQDTGPYPPYSSNTDMRGERVNRQPSAETFYPSDSIRSHSSTERILANPAQHAVTSPSIPSRGLQRNDFTTFQPVQRTPRVNGRDENSFTSAGPNQLRQRRPTMDDYVPRQPARLLGRRGGQSPYDFDSFQDVPLQSTPNWRPLTHAGPSTAAPPPPSVQSPEATSPQFPFALVPLDVAATQQAEARARGEDQTFLSLSTAPRRPTFGSVAPASTRSTSGGFSARVASFLPGRRRNTSARAASGGDSFTSVMRAGLEEHGPAPAQPRAFLPGVAGTSPSVPPTLHPPPPSRQFRSGVAGRYGHLDEDIELGVFGSGAASAGIERSSGGRGSGGNNWLARRWSS